jgi:hypothetical protein
LQAASGDMSVTLVPAQIVFVTINSESTDSMLHSSTLMHCSTHQPLSRTHGVWNTQS